MVTSARVTPAVDRIFNSSTKQSLRWRPESCLAARKPPYDGFGRTIKVETGHDGTTYNTADTGYGACGCSPLGKVVKVSLPYGAGETEVWTSYTYDVSGRQLTSTAPDGSVTTTSYSGNSVTTTDPAGAWKTNVMDAFGNITTVNEPDPATGTTTSNSPVTSYTYNGANQLVGVSMTRGGITQNRTFGYSKGDLISETTPEAGTVTYTYDGNHHVTQRIDALNQKSTYGYDAYERLSSVQHYKWVSGLWVDQTAQDVNYYYDYPIATDYTQNYTWGRLSGVTFSSAGGQPFAYEYSYNQAGRVTGNRMLVTNSGNGSVDMQGQYAWDNQGRMTSMTYPSGNAVNYQFDAMGRPSGMTGTWNTAYATYGTANQILTLGGEQLFPGGSNAWMSETRTYNSMLQLTHLTASTGGYVGFSRPGAGADMQYIYNTGHNNGRVSQTIDNVLGETVNYTYDYLHRLTGATATNSSWGEAYSFDGFGNLTGKTPTVGSAPPFVGSVGSNAAGGALPANFDMENRLTGVGNSSYGYDPWGRRVWKYNGATGTAEAYFYGVTGQKLETYSCTWDSNGTLWGSSVGINSYFAGKMLSEKGVFLATDRLGSVRGDSNGVSMSYYPWGEERGSGTADNRTKFAGYFRDMPGQDYAMARYYSATSGSFWSPDPGSISTADSSVPSSWNRYAYTVGDPINFFDPEGLSSESPPSGCIINGLWWPDIICSSQQSGPSHPGPAGLNPPPLNPQTAWQLAKAFQTRVSHSNGAYTDCQALADFTADAASVSPTAQDFVKDLGVLIPKGLAAQIGLNYWNAQAVLLNGTGEDSGYAALYQNTEPDNPTTGANGDQGHHFAAFFEFGYQYGKLLGDITAVTFEWFQAAFGSLEGGLNMGDIQLGITAVQMGANLKSGKIGADEVADLIRSNLCKH